MKNLLAAAAIAFGIIAAPTAHADAPFCKAFDQNKQYITACAHVPDNHRRVRMPDISVGYDDRDGAEQGANQHEKPTETRRFATPNSGCVENARRSQHLRIAER